MKLISLVDELKNNAYPGRGILLGRSADGAYAIAAYFIMGRSENSRNRVFTQTDDGIRTEAFDLSRAIDPSLIIYHPVRAFGGRLIVSNGDQTDTIWEAIKTGRLSGEALRSRDFEPDAPHYTPRISGVLQRDGSYQLSILKSLDGDPTCCQRFFYEYTNTPAGVGHFIHTYQQDGTPLPSFNGEPRAVSLAGELDTLADSIWSSLNDSNKVSLYVSYTNLATGEIKSVICNKNH